MAEEAINKEYEEAHRKVDESFEGKIFVRYKMPDGRINDIIYHSDLPAFKREIEEGKTYLANNLVDFGIIKIQETEKGKRIKLEKIDLSKVNENEGIIKLSEKGKKEIEKSRKKIRKELGLE